eukprot:gene22879-30054_t
MKPASRVALTGLAAALAATPLCVLAWRLLGRAASKLAILKIRTPGPSGSPHQETPFLDVVLISSDGQLKAVQGCTAIAEELKGGEVVGLDCEWEPERKDGVHNRVAVLQLCGATTCVVVQTLHLGDSPAGALGMIPPALQSLLEDPAVVKSAVDLRLVVQQYAPNAMNQGGGLQTLCSANTGCPCGQDITMAAPWRRQSLSRDEVSYAALDAWLARELSMTLFKWQELGTPPHLLAPPNSGQPLSTPSSESPSQIDEAAGDTSVENNAKGWTVRDFLKPFFDRFKVLSVHKERGGGAGGPRPRKPLTLKPLKPQSMPARKTVLYENCRLLAPDGKVLCTCSHKKAMWYIERDIATKVQDEPLTVQLHFEPRGRGNADDDYYLADKENRCCVCGLDGEYLRHQIVPRCYRSRFPGMYKTHLSHDIVLMCRACHQMFQQMSSYIKCPAPADFQPQQKYSSPTPAP